MASAIPLRRWIKGALDEENVCGALSTAYVKSSLRIALSLAQQIHNVEQPSNVGLSCGLDSLPPPFPVACIDWADCVTIGLKSTNPPCNLHHPHQHFTIQTSPDNGHSHNQALTPLFSTADRPLTTPPKVTGVTLKMDFGSSPNRPPPPNDSPLPNHSTWSTVYDANRAPSSWEGPTPSPSQKMSNGEADDSDSLLRSLHIALDLDESAPSPPASDSAQVQVHEFEDLLDVIARDAQRRAEDSMNSYHFSSLGTSGSAQYDSRDTDEVCYLSVECAQISSKNSIKLCSNAASNHVDALREKLQRIYSLGLVLYELFSGGEMPPPEILVVSSACGLTAISTSGVERTMIGVTSNDHPRNSTDFASTLKISQETIIEGDGHMCEILNRNNFLNDRLNKRQSTFRQFTPSNSVSFAGTSGPSHALCNVSVEHLHIKGVPRPLCDLVYNMIDCINGDFRGNDAYSEMSGVIDDLQLMLDKPSVFLQNLDIDKLVQTGLEFDDTLFVRDHEFDSLLSTYGRFVTGSSELAIITGVSGTGKSVMARRFGHVIAANGGLFLEGKFDQMPGVKSCSGVASVLNDYCNVLARSEECERATLIASELRTSVGTDLRFLIQAIPKLGKILNEESTDQLPEHDCAKATKRLHYLLSQFVEVISRCLGTPITLFMDDVQWADLASTSIISQLLTTLRSSNERTQFFFLGCCRDNEMDEDHIFWKMTKHVCSLGLKTTIVKLDCMNKDTLHDVVARLLHLSPRLVRSLSDIVYHKTKGNPLFFSRMMLSLNKEGLLHLSLTRRRWEWDEDKINARKLPGDVAMFFIQSIGKLPSDVKEALGTLSCFGASIGCDIVQYLETNLDMNLIEPLNVAIAEGLVTKHGGKYRFSHDRIQEAAYGLMEEQDCCVQHMSNGLSLIDLALITGKPCLLFTAVTQVNLGGPSAVRDSEHYSLIASYNLMAGKRAMEMSDFSSAFSFFDNGMSFLRKNHWQDQYDLSLELFHLAAKSAVAIKNITSLNIICDEVSKNARCFGDTLNTSFVLMSALTHSWVEESIELGMTTLAQLDVDIPNSPSREDTLQLISQTQSMLEGIPDETLVSYHIMSDHKMLMAMKFLAKLENSLQQVKPTLQPLVTIKMVRTTIEHGISCMSSIGFAYFGGMLAEIGDVRGGYRFTKLALALLHKFQNTDMAGEVIWLSTEILSYIEPLQLTNEYRHQGQNIAMSAGDIHWACLNKLIFSSTLIWSGVKLPVVKEAFARAKVFMAEQCHLTSLYYLRIFERSISVLMGDENETLSDEQMTITVAENKNPYQLVIFYFHKMFLCLVLNGSDDLKQCVVKFIEFDMPSWFLLSGRAIQSFITSLASFKIYRETGDLLWAERAKTHKERISRWKEQGSLWNFEHKSYLLDAEECYSNGDFKRAQVFYNNAISSAQRHKFVHEEAISCELAGSFHLNIGNKESALKHYIDAHGKYLEWGALAKAIELSAVIQRILAGASTLSEHGSRVSSDKLSTDFDAGTRKRRPL
eukprot:CCRYP_015795-RD/>CCRYP_015795-RD protein AED:0.06 eAED:0.06 QI:0/1/0.8/1/0.75/0.6/5/465/1505